MISFDNCCLSAVSRIRYQHYAVNILWAWLAETINYFQPD